MKNTIFGFLANRFSGSAENLATEGLNYILNNSTTAREAFLHFVTSNSGVQLPDNLLFETQVKGDEGAIPDLVGKDANGREVLVCEAKFWAGLTQNQPMAYLSNLPASDKALLLFIAPEVRISTLWPEIKRICIAGGFAITDRKSPAKALKVVNVNSNHTMAITSWGAVLNVVRQTLESEGNMALASDVSQLQGLCDQMDSVAFHPVKASELSAGIGLRIYQYCQLVDEVTTRLINMKQLQISTQGCRATPFYAGYMRYMKTTGWGLGVQFNAKSWSEHRETPLWLSVQAIIDPRKWSFPHEGLKLLNELEHETPPRLIKQREALLVPLFIPVDSDKDRVVEDVVGQITDVIVKLNRDKKD